MGKKLEDAAVAVGASIGVIVMSVAVLFLKAWFAMLLLGVWHAHNDVVPALGYTDSLFLAAVIGILTAASRD